GYQLLRSPAYKTADVPTIAKSDPHCSPTACSYTDSDLAPGTGYRYQVEAVRSAGPGTTTGVTSTSAPSQKVDVPAPASPTTAGAAGGAAPGAAAGTSGATTGNTAAGAGAPLTPALARTGRVDLSGFAALLGRSQATAARPGPEPDPGFQTALPYAPRDPAPGGGDSPVSRPDALGAPDRRSPVRPWGLFALGLLATAVAVHLLWLRGQVQMEPALELLADPATSAPSPVPGEAWRSSQSPNGQAGAPAESTDVRSLVG
ncbi:MAG TPA: hypothetical protein VKI64_05210, partial [Acidimicrobiales bacterium]|nr:hypothetical protein [Acidimicrobiales bacterium]